MRLLDSFFEAEELARFRASLLPNRRCIGFLLWLGAFGLCSGFAGSAVAAESDAVSSALPPTGGPAPAPSANAAPGGMLERDEDAPLAGYTNNTPFIRSRDSNFVLFPSGRLNIDGFFFLNRGAPAEGITPDGASDARPRHTIFLRRVRAEFMGTILKHFDYMLAGEFANAPSGGQSASATDVFVNINYTTWANVQVGQFDAPFTMENRTIDKYIDFMERSITVRSFGIPSNKDLGLMVSGLAPSRFFHYELGVFNGDGIDVRNPDNHFDFMGRAYIAPLALLKQSSSLRWLGEIWIGGSLWYGRRVDVPYPTPNLTTQGGVTLLPSSFGSGLQLVPNGDVLKWAVEVNIPIGPVGWRFELVHSDRENLGVYRPADASVMSEKGLTRVLSGAVNRNGTSFYAEMWYWIFGNPNVLLPTPGNVQTPRWAGYRKGKESWPLGFYVAARYERLILHQDDISDSGMALSDAQKVALGTMSVDSFGIAANAWFTRHIRFSANYLVNYLDGDMALIQGGVKLAPPGNTGQPTSLFYRTAEHELLFRVAFGL